MDIEKNVIAITVDYLGVDEAKVTMSADFVEDLGADSLDIVELIMAFEEDFNFEITDEEATACKTVGNVVEFLTAKQ